MIKMWNRPFKFLTTVSYFEKFHIALSFYTNLMTREGPLLDSVFLVLYYIISLPCFEKSHKLYNTVLNMKKEQITFHQQLCCLNSTKLRWEKLMILEQVDFVLTGRGCAKFAWWNHSIIIDSKSIIFWFSHNLPQYKIDFYVKTLY